LSYARSRRATRLTPNAAADTGSVPSPESGCDHQRVGPGVDPADGPIGRVGGHGDRHNGRRVAQNVGGLSVRTSPDWLSLVQGLVQGLVQAGV